MKLATADYALESAATGTGLMGNLQNIFYE